MKLVAIYNCWADGLDLLKHSVDNILPVVDRVIIVWSEYSNTMQYKPFLYNSQDEKVKLYKFEGSETEKRNFGLQMAKCEDFTHFLIMDSDEFYIKKEVLMEKNMIEQQNLNGTVCRLKVLFKKPTLCVDDHTLVPFIHKLTPDVRCGNFKDFPFAYDNEGHAHIDPTRRLNIYSGIEMSYVTMWHASWIRKDFDLKIENSAARNNLKKSSIYKDLDKAAPGVYNDFYRKELVNCENHFNLPEL